MAWRQPWDVVCRCCKAKKGRVCRSRITRKSMEDRAHEVRWNDSLTGHSPLLPSAASGRGTR